MFYFGLPRTDYTTALCCELWRFLRALCRLRMNCSSISWLQLFEKKNFLNNLRWEFMKENKKVRKQENKNSNKKAIKKIRKKQELDQEKKKKKSFFLITFLVEFLFSDFLVFFYKFPPQDLFVESSECTFNTLSAGWSGVIKHSKLVSCVS